MYKLAHHLSSLLTILEVALTSTPLYIWITGRSLETKFGNHFTKLSRCTYCVLFFTFTMSLQVLSASDVDKITQTFSPSELSTLMAHVFSHLSSASNSFLPHRTTIPTSRHTALFMPARIAHATPPLLTGTTIKVVCVPTSPTDTRGLPSSTLILDENTGAAKAIVNARTLTALRTAAGLHPLLLPKPIL